MLKLYIVNGDTKVGVVTSTLENTYPNNAKKDDYWYVYKGVVDSNK